MNKCILSIDVGIKNLALCVVGVTSEKIPTILYWKLSNVLLYTDIPSTKKKVNNIKLYDSEGRIIHCQANKRNGKPCTNAAVVTRMKSFCGLHDSNKKKNNVINTQKICYGLQKTLKDIGEEIRSIPITEVIIEQQCLTSKLILMQSHLIFGFFVSLYDNKIPIRFIPAYNKLLVYDGPLIECSLKSKYAQRKYLGKKHTEYFLNKLQLDLKWKNFYISCKGKQDDIADAFLSGLYYVYKENPIESLQQTSKKTQRRKKLKW